MATISTTARPAYVYDAGGDQWVPIAWTVLGSGSASAPALTFTGDSNTGLWSPGADTVAFSTGGSERLRINSSGQVATGLGATATPALTFIGDEDTGVWSPSANVVAVSTNGLERLRIGSGGNVGIGTTTPSSRLVVAGNIGSQTFGSTGQLLFDRSNGTSSAPTVVSSGDLISRVISRGYDGSAIQSSAFIDVAVDGAPSSGVVPGRFMFSTVDASGVAAERMRIDSAGQVTVGLGSAAAPVLSFSGDTNTGVYSPAADNVSLSTGGTERLRVDSSGNTFGVAAQNLLYNGAMQVAQRSTSVASITSGGYYTADRWNVGASSLGTWTQSVENDAPTGSGFRKSLKMLCTTADASPAAGDHVNISEPLEGQDCQRIAKGTSSAQQLTLSFWVKSNVTGTFIAGLYDNDNSRSVSASYTISASATWERKTITFPADTTGALDNDNAVSLYVQFWLGAGSNFTSGTLNTSWAANDNTKRAVGQTNLAAAINNYWQVTGVQLEVGPIASPFQFKSYGQELAQCQRYYYRQGGLIAYQTFAIGINSSTTESICQVPFPVTMRTTPSAVDSSTLAVQEDLAGGVIAATGISLSNVSPENGQVAVTVASGLTKYRPVRLLANNSTSAYIGFSAEL